MKINQIKSEITEVIINDSMFETRTFHIIEHEDGSYHLFDVDHEEVNEAHSNMNDCFAELTKFQENQTEFIINNYMDNKQ